jgi:hypothetical protein
LKWRTIEELIKRDVESYELGAIAAPATFGRIYSQKQYGISRFKEGWARDGKKPVFLCEKYFDSALLSKDMDQHFKNLQEYFNFGGHEPEN